MLPMTEKGALAMIRGEYRCERSEAIPSDCFVVTTPRNDRRVEIRNAKQCKKAVSGQQSAINNQQAAVSIKLKADN